MRDRVADRGRTAGERANVFVVGLDDVNREILERMPGAERCRFHQLLTVAELQHGEIRFDDLLDKAVRQLDAFEDRIDAVVGFWDFPVATLVPMLCARYGLPSSSLESIVKCEHKYWSRLEQRKAIDATPRFSLVDLEERTVPPGLRYPMWLKPVKSFSSELAFRVADDAEFHAAVAEIADGIDRVGEPFEHVLCGLDLPAEVDTAGGQACLAEEALSGAQAATEGYVYRGEPVITGVLDSVTYPGSSSFLRHQYPSQLPDSIQRTMRELSVLVVRQLGLDSVTFSIEFFCDPGTGDVALLEINPRHSQSHAELFRLVDGVPNHHSMVCLGLGEDPAGLRCHGDYRIAAKWYHRRDRDGVVRRVPTAAELDRVRDRLPGVEVHAVPTVGDRLSELPEQDSYSFELAHVIVGANSPAELEDKYRRCVDQLDLDIEDITD